MSAPDVVLGSASPRRRDLLTGLVPVFRIVPPHIDEVLRPGEGPLAFARRMALEKNEAIRKNLDDRANDTVVVTADTVVAIDDRILGKPSDYAEAHSMIALLAGRTHRVVTGMTLWARARGEALTGHEETAVTFRTLNSDDIDEYLSSIHWADKAGSYAYQEHRDRIIAATNGSATNIIGFPLRLFFGMAARAGLTHLLFLPGGDGENN